MRPVSRACRQGMLLAAFLAVLLALLPQRAALAHAELIESTPEDGAVVDASPTAIVLRFSEAVTPIDDGNHVVDAAGTTVADAVEAEGDTLHIVVPEPLADGSYLVTWGVISADSHPIRGSFVFHVGAPGEPITVAAPTQDVPAWLDAGLPAARWLGYASALLAGGLAVFLAVVHDHRGTEQRRLATLGSGAAVVGLATVPLLLALQAADIAGDASGLTDGGAWDAALASSVGDQSGALAAGLVMLLAGFTAGPNPVARGLGIAGLVLAAWAFALSGHSATADPRWLATLATIIHAAAAATWAGGLVGLAVVLVARRSGGVPALAVVRRFSQVALGAVVVVALAGILLAAIEIPSWGALVEERYGQVLIAKSVLVAATVAVAAFNRRRLVPQSDGAAQTGSALRATVRVEIVAIAAILGLTAVLVAQNPAPSTAVAGSGPAPSTVVRDGFLGDYHVVLTVSPGADAARTIEVVFHAFGEADPATIQAVDIELSLPDRDIGPLRRSMEAAAPGVFRLTANDLVVAGDWSLRIAARVSDFEQETITFELPIGTGG